MPRRSSSIIAAFEQILTDRRQNDGAGAIREQATAMVSPDDGARGVESSSANVVCLEGIEPMPCGPEFSCRGRATSL